MLLGGVKAYKTKMGKIIYDLIARTDREAPTLSKKVRAISSPRTTEEGCSPRARGRWVETICLWSSHVAQLFTIPQFLMDGSDQLFQIPNFIKIDGIKGVKWHPIRLGRWL